MYRTKEQEIIKKERDDKRKQYLDDLYKKTGNQRKKLPEGFTKSGRNIYNTKQAEFNSENSSGESFGNSSGNADYIVQEQKGSIVQYLNSGLSGFDCYFNLDKPRIKYYDDIGGTRTYDELKFVSMRLATGTVDSSNYEAKWSSAITVYEVGTDGDVANNEDYTENPFHYTKNYLADNNYTLIVKYDLGSSTHPTWYWNGWYIWSTFSTTLDNLIPPVGSFSQANNSFNFTSYEANSARVLEFNRSNYTPYSSYRGNEVHNILYNCTLRNHERDIYDGQANPQFAFNTLTMWDVGTYEIKLEYDSSHPTATRSEYSDALNDWITLMNSTISGSGVSFTRNDASSNPDILYQTKSVSYMGSNTGGTWETYVDSDGWIYYANIKITYDIIPYLEHQVQHVTTEELTQACGCGGDLRTRADIINTDFNYWQKSYGSVSFSTIDAQIQKLLYTEDLYLYVGATSDEFALALNPYNGYLTTTGTLISLENFPEGVTYNYRTWQAKSNDAYSVVLGYSSTLTPNNYPDVPTGLIADSPPRTDGGSYAELNLKWNSASNADFYNIRYKINGGSYTIITNIPNIYYTIQNLEYGTTHYISVQSGDDYYKPYSAWTSDVQLTTAPKTPSLFYNSKTLSTVTFSISVSEGNWSFVKIWYRKSGTSDVWQSVTVNNPITSGTVTGLTNNTEYEFKASSFYTVGTFDVESVDSAGNVDYSDLVYVTPSNNWEWSYTIDVGENVQSVLGKNIYIMNASEWNNFTNRINIFRNYIDNEYGTSLGNYSFTTVSSGTNFTTTILNQAFNAIRDMSSYFTGGNTLPNNVITGDPILKAEYFIKMRDCLNSIV